MSQESFEWADLRTLTDDEIKPHSQYALPGMGGGLPRTPALPSPVASKALLPAAVTPLVPGATAAQVLTAGLLTVLSSPAHAGL